jgi:diguanylate cyclase
MSTRLRSTRNTAHSSLRLSRWLTKLDQRQAFLILMCSVGATIVFVLGLWRLSQNQIGHSLFDFAVVILMVAICRCALVKNLFIIAVWLATAIYLLGLGVVIERVGLPGLFWVFPVIYSFFVMRTREAMLVVFSAYLLSMIVVWPQFQFETIATFSSCFLLVSIYGLYMSRRVSEDRDLLEHAAGTDALTGLLNRRSFDDDMRTCIDQQRQAPGSHALLVLDIDNFKSVNDLFGHVVGDKCLERLARLLESFESDVCRFYRLGGEEFVALFTGSKTDATGLAEAVCERIRSKTLLREHGHAVTVSIGLAMLEGLEDGRAWLQRADRALYDAKQAGRDRVVVAV